jgi:hypothetical protein
VKRKSKFVQPGTLEATNKKRLRSQGLPHAASQPTHVTPSPHDHVTDPPPTHETPPSPTHVTPSPTHVTPTHDIPSLGSEDDYVHDDVDEELNITDKKKPRYWEVEVISMFHFLIC